MYNVMEGKNGVFAPREIYEARWQIPSVLGPWAKYISLDS